MSDLNKPLNQQHRELTPMPRARGTRRNLLGMALAVLIWSGAAYAQSPAETLTLSQALTLAQQNNRQIRIAGLQIDQAQQRTAAARTNLLPQISVEAQSGRLLNQVSANFPAGSLGTINGSPVPSQDVNLTSSGRFTSSYNITVAQPLTQLPRIRTGIRLQETGTQIAREQERQQRQSIASTVRQTYFAILRTQDGITANNTILQHLQELERTIGDAVQQGSALRVDLLEVQAKHAEQEATLNALRDTLAQYKEQMNVLLGRDMRTPFEVATGESELPDLGDEDHLVERALQRRPDLQIGALQVRQAQLNHRLTEQQNTPEVSLATTYKALQNHINGLPGSFWTIGFHVTWNGLDWGRSRREASAQARGVDQAKVAQENAIAQVEAEIRTLVRRRHTAQEQERAARLTREAAQERVRVTMNQFQLKAVLLKDVLQALATLADANRQVQEASLAHLSVWSDLQRAVGDE